MPDCGAAPYSRPNYARRRVWAALGVVVVVGLAVSLWMLLSSTGMITFFVVFYGLLVVIAVAGGLAKAFGGLERHTGRLAFVVTIVVIAIWLSYTYVQIVQYNDDEQSLCGSPNGSSTQLALCCMAEESSPLSEKNIDIFNELRAPLVGKHD